MAEIITVATPKGGVGKTTICYHIAHMLSEKYQTLFIDIDSQGNSTKYLLNGESVPEESNIVNLFRKKPIKPLYLKDNLSLVGSNILLSEFDSKSDLNFFFSLHKYLKTVKKKYDYIVIDTPPNLGLFTVNALLATNYVISPLDPSEDAYDGLEIILQTIREIKEDHNDSIQLLGFALNLFDQRNKADNTIAKRLTKNYSDLLFKTFIPRATKIRDARLSYKSIFELDPKGSEKITVALRQLFTELNERIGE